MTPFVLGALSPLVVEDLELTRAQFGVVLSALFLTAMLASPLVGRIVDTTVRRRLLPCVFGLAAVALAFMSLAWSFGLLLCAAVVAGMADATTNPITNKLIASGVPRRLQGLVVGTKQSGVQIGAVVSGSVLPAVAAVAGWRIATIIAVAACGGLAVLALGLATPSGHPRVDAPDHVANHRRDITWLAAYAYFLGGGVAASVSYLSLYAHEELGLAPGSAGRLVAAMGISGVIGRLLWGYISNRTEAVGHVLLFIAILACVAQLMIWQADTIGTWSLWAASIGIGLSAMSWNSAAMIAVMRDHSGQVGRASGRIMVGFYAGLTTVPPAFGYTVDRTDSYMPAWLAIAGLFLVAAIVAASWNLCRPKRTVRRSFS